MAKPVHSYTRRIAWASLWALGLAGCARDARPVASADVLAAELRVEALESTLEERDQRIRGLENRMALLEAEAREIRDALARKERAQASGLRETVRIGSHVRETRVESAEAEPRPMLRLHESRAPEATATYSSTSSDAPTRQRRPLPPLPPPVSERLPVAPLPPASVVSMPEAPTDAAGAYRQALGLLRKRDFDRALSALSAFLVRYPGDTRTSDVLYWRGEVQFALADYEGALSSFHGALKARPSGERAPDALLKVGLCHRQLGAHAQARAVFERLKSQFPESRAAKLVSQEDAS